LPVPVDSVVAVDSVVDVLLSVVVVLLWLVWSVVVDEDDELSSLLLPHPVRTVATIAALKIALNNFFFIT
jgi:type IV secretory pathway VirB3-like protein